MAPTFQTKTQASITADPFTTTLPSGATTGDILVLVALSNNSSMRLDQVSTQIWTPAVARPGSGNHALMAATCLFTSGDPAPVILSANGGVYVIYRYTGKSVHVGLNYVGYQVTTGSTAPVSAPSGAEVMWVGAVTDNTVSAVAVSRGTTETTNLQNGTNKYFLTITREALGSAISMASATLTPTGTPDHLSGGGIVVGDSQTAWVMKGRDTASADTTGAA